MTELWTLKIKRLNLIPINSINVKRKNWNIFIRFQSFSFSIINPIFNMKQTNRTIEFSVIRYSG